MEAEPGSGLQFQQRVRALSHGYPSQCLTSADLCQRVHAGGIASTAPADIQADRLHPHNGRGAGSSANNSVFLSPHKRWQATHRAPAEDYSVAALPAGEFQSCLPHTTAYKQIWGLLLQPLERRPCPQQDCGSHRGKRRPLWTFSVGSGRHTGQSPHRRDSG